MQEYKVYEVDEKTTQTGKQLKKLVLQKEGDQWPIKNVTMWSDHPDYMNTVSGGTLTCTILEKDSKNINPKNNLPYKERTVGKPGQVNSAPAAQLSEMGIKTHIDRKFDALQADLKIIADHLGVEPPKVTSDKPQAVQDAQEITPDDIPF